MPCPFCEVFRKEHPLVTDDDGDQVHVIDYNEDGSPGMTSSPIGCAFEDSDTFSSDNWCCETMDKLRSLLYDETIPPSTRLCVWHNDSSVGVIPIPITEDEAIQQGMLVLSWYKHRGRTGQAMIFWDNTEPEVLNLRTALYIIAKYHG